MPTVPGTTRAARPRERFALHTCSGAAVVPPHAVSSAFGRPRPPSQRSRPLGFSGTGGSAGAGRRSPS